MFLSLWFKKTKNEAVRFGRPAFRCHPRVSHDVIPGLIGDHWISFG